MVGYEISRPKLIFGEFRTQDPTPEALERRVELELGNSVQWAWGGGAAAMRLTKHFHGGKTILHISDPTNDLLKRLRALPANDGPFIIYRTPSKVAFEGTAPRTMHPLLVYAELMATGDSRARETAMEIREHYLNITIWEIVMLFFTIASSPGPVIQTRAGSCFKSIAELFFTISSSCRLWFRCCCIRLFCSTYASCLER
jgi:hypothetical protein